MSTPLEARWRRSLRHRVALAAALVALIAWAVWWSEFDLRALVSAGPRFAEFFGRLTPPDWSVADLLLRSTVETFMIALAGTFCAVAAALPLGFLAATNVSPPWVSHPAKWLLGFLRSIPLIVVALLFVAAIGLGPFPGALAIAFHSVGMLGKFYAEEFETADRGIVNAV
ncbi:MAG: PhnE/PtxC family ABC transporter permease, partial [Terriglobia bacterium]